LTLNIMKKCFVDTNHGVRAKDNATIKNFSEGGGRL